MLKRIVSFVLLLFSAHALAAEKVDVCVYGGTAGGVAAAVTVSKEGKSVILIEPGRHLGGMSSGGLGQTDFGNKQVIGGLSRLEGAWLGAIAYTLIDYYSRQDAPTLGLWINKGRFATIIGIVFLLIVLLSPDGLIGIGHKLRPLLARALGEPQRAAPETAQEEEAVPEQAGVSTTGGASSP